MWKREEHGERVWLTPKGRAQVRKLIHEERTRRFEAKSRWIPLLSVILAIIGALTSLVALTVQRKSADAATMAAENTRIALELNRKSAEITQHVFEANLGDFGVANLSRQSVGWAIKNSGKTAAEKVRWSASLKVTNLINGTVVQSTSQSSSPPFNIKEGDPPFVFAFPLSDIAGRNFESESFRIDVSITYENGFGKEVSQSFCREIVGKKHATPSLDFGVYECFEAEPYRDKRIKELHAKKTTP